MAKLISAGLLRLRKCAVFYITCAAAAAICCALVYSHLGDYEDYSASLRLCLFDHVPLVGLICSVFIGLMLGAEYSDGTMRNKIIVGHKRVNVYLSYVIVSAIGAVIVSALCLTVTVILGLTLYKSIGMSVGACLWMCFCEMMIAAASASAAALVAACTKSRSITAVMCIIVFLGLLFLGSYINGRLEEPEFIDYYMMTSENGMPMEVETAPNPRYVSGTERTALELICEFDPAGQSVLMSNFSATHPERLPLMSLLFIITTTAAGCVVFKKKDLV